MPPKKKTNGYKMPEPITQGEVLQDINKKQWRLGPSIGKGGFGEIYSAQEATDKKSTQYPFVVKIEPHTNGPLFVEMHFLLRNAKKDDIDAFINDKNLKSFGMPQYIGSGSHEYNSEKYRFIVLEKFGSDIWKLFLENKREFPIVTVFKIGIQILDVLEYIHARGYVHHDIKGANILLDLKNKNQVYLLDFGLAAHYFTGNVFKPDPKKAHDGTIEYVSRDGHNGLQTRRGDLEILGYNLIQWLGCTLPWEKMKTPTEVQKSKDEYMNDIPELMKVCFKDKNPPKTIMEYFIYLTTLNFDSEPDYKKVHKILTNGIDSNGGSIKSPLTFIKTKTPTKRKGVPETPSSGKKPRLPRRKLDVNEKEDDGDDQVSSSAPKKKTETAKKKKAEENGATPDDVNEESPNLNVEENGEKEEVQVSEIAKGNKKKGKKAKKGKTDQENDTNNGNEENDMDQEEEGVMQDKVKSKGTKRKKAKKNDAKPTDGSEEEGASSGDTAEMKRIKAKLAAKKPKGRKPNVVDVENTVPSTSSEDNANKRKRNKVNYRE